MLTRWPDWAGKIDYWHVHDLDQAAPETAMGEIEELVGELLDRLTEIGIRDRCLLIVTADHGISFRAGQDRRVPEAGNADDGTSVLRRRPTNCWACCAPYSCLPITTSSW